MAQILKSMLLGIRKCARKRNLPSINKEPQLPTCRNWRVRVVRKSHQYAEISVCAKSEEEAKKTAKRILSGETRGWKSIYVDYDVTIIPRRVRMKWSFDKTQLYKATIARRIQESGEEGQEGWRCRSPLPGSGMSDKE